MTLNDMDIAKDSTIILESSKSVVETILERRSELDHEGKQDQPLVVISGEFAQMPAHAVHLIAILDSLKDKERVALGYERGHEVVQKGFSEASGVTPNAEQADYLQDQDGIGAVTLKYTLGGQLEYAHRALLSFLLDQNIPTRFTDASSNWNNGRDFNLRTLDESDPSTASSLRACFNGQSRADIHPETPEGFRVRNRHMSVQSLDFAKASNARIVIQLCGSFHVIGSTPNYPACDSLAANLRALGAPVLAMPSLTQYLQERDIPADHGLSAKELLLVKGLPEVAVDIGSGSEAWTEGADYAAPLVERCSLDSARLAVDRYSQFKQQYAKDVARIFTACKKIAPRTGRP